ncbi:acyltransferase family protein [Corallococcus coralloides]|uniref:Acyltransferase family protein n=1 Tax=Corallococcus coralloides TaxID=184914 RepID=A0A410RL18_CORCK|nr:acyltransferase [Corallococcus coralloides]QAT82585.1 acyltransferase family protein [Corallococcus coralloides]
MKQQSGGSLDALTGLRFLAALHVVLFHFGTPCLKGVAPEWMVQVMASGYASVGVFFLLSGFVLAYNYVDTAGGMQTPARAFWSARVARVYPVFLLMFLLSAVPTAQGSLAANSVPVAAAKLTTAGLTVLMLLQSWVPKLALYWNPPSWSVSVEAFFYAVFPALAGRLERFRGARMTAALVGVWLLGLLPPVLYLVLRPDGPGTLDAASGGMWLTVVKFNPLMRLPEFLLGVLLGLVFVRERAAATVASRRSGAVMALAGAALLVAGFSQGARIPYPLMHNALLAPASALLVYGLARGGGVLGKALARPWLVHLGGPATRCTCCSTRSVSWCTRWSGSWTCRRPRASWRCCWCCWCPRRWRCTGGWRRRGARGCGAGFSRGWMARPRGRLRLPGCRAPEVRAAARLQRARPQAFLPSSVSMARQSQPSSFASQTASSSARGSTRPSSSAARCWQACFSTEFRAHSQSFSDSSRHALLHAVSPEREAQRTAAVSRKRRMGSGEDARWFPGCKRCPGRRVHSRAPALEEGRARGGGVQASRPLAEGTSSGDPRGA